MGLKERITAANAKFLSADHFAEEIKFWPGGNPNHADVQTFDGVWDDDQLEGKNQIEGEGTNLETRGGRRIRRTVQIEAPISLPVDEQRSAPDVFKRVATGEIVQLKRISGKDHAIQTLECVRTTADTTRYPSRRG